MCRTASTALINKTPPNTLSRKPDVAITTPGLRLRPHSLVLEGSAARRLP